MHLWVCACLCSCACTHMCNMPASVRGGFHACTQTLVSGRMNRRVYVLRSCCPHAHPRLRAASLLLTCASPHREIFARSLRKAANITTDRLPSPVKILPCLLASWRDADPSRLDQREAAALAHMRSCCALSEIDEWKQEDSVSLLISSHRTKHATIAIFISEMSPRCKMKNGARTH